MKMEEQGASLEEIRGRIDEIDRNMRTLFEQRMLLADQVARVKARTGDDIFQPDREASIIAKRSEGVDEKILKE